MLGYYSRFDTQHIRIGWDTAHYSESGGDTAQENVFKYLYWGGDTAHNTTYYSESGGTPHKKMCSNVLIWGETVQRIQRQSGGHRTKSK